MHKVNPKDYRAKVHRRGRDDLPLTGCLPLTDALIPTRLGWPWSNYLERKANRLKVRRLDDYNGLKPVSNQYKCGPIERMLIPNIGQQQLLRSL
jgi:hypothetical protein